MLDLEWCTIVDWSWLQKCLFETKFFCIFDHSVLFFICSHFETYSVNSTETKNATLVQTYIYFFLGSFFEYLFSVVFSLVLYNFHFVHTKLYFFYSIKMHWKFLWNLLHFINVYKYYYYALIYLYTNWRLVGRWRYVELNSSPRKTEYNAENGDTRVLCLMIYRQLSNIKWIWKRFSLVFCNDRWVTLICRMIVVSLIPTLISVRPDG